MPEQVLWAGASGQQYRYFVYPLDAPFKETGGNYILAEGDSNPGYWTAVYIGQTENLNHRFENKDQEACALEHGATEIHAHISQDPACRKAEVEDLIKRRNPPCRDQADPPGAE